MMLDVMKKQITSETFCENFTCSLCSYETTKLRKIHKHFRKEHSMTDLLQCPFCKYIVTEEALFSQHKQIVHPKDRFFCRVCKFSTKKWTRWKRHLMDGHSESMGVGECVTVVELKKNILTQQNSMNSGMEDFQTGQSEGNTDVLHFTQKHCSNICNDKKSLTCQGLIHEEDTLSFVCEFCNEVFNSSDDFRSHRVIHTNNETRMHEICDKPFMDKIESHRHVAVHASQLRFKCKKCDKSFKRKKDLRRHSKLHMSDNPLICPHCEKSFTYESYLKQHLISHSNERPHVCHLCDKSFKFKKNLNRHGKIHTGEGLYTCKYCGASFSHKDNLRVHIRIHTGEKPYQCSYCSYATAYSSSLKNHERTHRGEQRYQCDVCDYGSVWLGTLKVHNRIHTGEKPYQCDVCLKYFGRKRNLKNHMASMH